MQPLLTIAIPSYNRVDCLKVLVERLLSEFEAIPNRNSVIELIVVNDASTDGTLNYLDTLGNIQVKIFHNVKNLGMDGNFIRCFELAKGRWFWLLGEDDLPMIGALEKIVETLSRDHNMSETECAMVYLPAKFTPGSLEHNSDHVRTANRFQVESSSKFAIRVGGLFTFISCIICNRYQYYEKIEHHEVAGLKGTLFAHLEWEFELLNSSTRFGYFYDPMIISRAENSKGYNFSKVFTQFFLHACNKKLGKFRNLNKTIVNEMRYRHLPKLFYMTRVGRNGGLMIDPSQAAQDYRAAFGSGPFFSFIMLPIFFLPMPLATAALFSARLWSKIWLVSSKLWINLTDHVRNN